MWKSAGKAKAGSNHYFMGDSVLFDAIDLTLTVEEIYARVDNDEVRSYVQEQQAQ